MEKFDVTPIFEGIIMFIILAIPVAFIIGEPIFSELLWGIILFSGL
ncbi:hypothetical protein [Clostridium cochlearium]|nr:hypothetical protein [Clostridium cochlearium]